MKTAVIVAVILIVVGAIILLGALSSVGFDISKFDSNSFQTKVYGVNGAFTGISVRTDDCSVRLVNSPDGGMPRRLPGERQDHIFGRGEE